MNGCCMGREKLRQELLAQTSERLGTERYAEERAQTAQAMAEQIIAEELKRCDGNKSLSRSGQRGIRPR